MQPVEDGVKQRPAGWWVGQVVLGRVLAYQAIQSARLVGFASMRRLREGMLVCLATPLLAVGCAALPAPSPLPPPAIYTCCDAADVKTLYQPGQTMTVHWTVEMPEGPVTGPSTVRLHASLTGPYATVDELKEAADDAHSAATTRTFTAAPVRPSGAAGEPPVSTIVIGREAKPGYYSLVTKVIDSTNASSTGRSIVQVVAAR